MIKTKTYLIFTLLLLFVACSSQKSLFKNNPSLEKFNNHLNLTVSNWDEIISTANLSDKVTKYWSETGIRGRYKLYKKYLSKSILENIVGEKTFLSGPHKEELDFNSLAEFGHYNPIFLSKLNKKLTVLFSNKSLVNNTQSLYDSKLKQYLRVYYLSYDIAANNKEIIDGYLKAISRPNENSYMNGMVSGPSWYLQESFRDFALTIDKDDYNVYEGFTCPGFWVRRSIDGTSDEFYDLLLLTMKTFDSEFIDSI